MANPNGRKGNGFEIDLQNGLREHGFDVERLRTTGKDDQGDLVIRDGHTILVEAKNHARIDLPGYLRELDAERKNYIAARRLDPSAVEGVVIVKARGKNWRKAFVVQTVESFFGLEDK